MKRILFLPMMWFALTAFTGLAAAGDTPLPANDPVVYIAGFTDAAGTRGWESVELAVRDLLMGAIAGDGRVRVVERERLDDLLREMEVTLQGLTDSSSSARLGKLLGADRIITGRLIIQDDLLTVVAHVIDVPTAVIHATCRADGRMADLLDIVIALAGDLSAALAIPFDPGGIIEIDVKPVLSLNFLRGLGFYYTGDYERAIMDFMISGDVEPDHIERHYWIARAFVALGEFDHARVELQRFLAIGKDPELRRDAQRLLEACEPSLQGSTHEQGI